MPGSTTKWSRSVLKVYTEQMDQRLRRLIVALSVIPSIILVSSEEAEETLQTTALDSMTPLIDELPEAIPASVCKRIIDTANRIGWNNDADSIDGIPSQDIYLWSRGVIRNEALFNLVDPYLDKLGDFVRTRKQRSLTLILTLQLSLALTLTLILILTLTLGLA